MKSAWRRRGLLLAVFSGFLLVLSPAVIAQISPDAAQQLLQLQQRGAGGGAVIDDRPQPDIIQLPEGQLPQSPSQSPSLLQPQPQLQPAAPRMQSRLEVIMSQRAGVNLSQFGYDRIGQGRSVTIPQTGAIQDDYILGPGDEIYVSLRGQENGEFRPIINRNGQVILPRLSPIPASGRSFGSFREDLQNAVRRAFVATDASVSVGRIRQISVLVTGEVNNPGQRRLSGLGSAVDAIMLSGGIGKRGSLRSVRVERGSRQFTIDLYGVLTGRSGASDLQLADGDKVIVPAIGRVVAVSGLVRQPAIYELPAGQSQIAVKALVALAGGEEVRGSYRYSVLRIAADGRTRLENVPGENATVGDSEILFVQPNADQVINQVTLAGGTGVAGTFPLAARTRLSEIIKIPGAIGPNPYTLFGLVARRDVKTQLRILVAFTPAAVLNGQEDIELQMDDIVRVFSVDEARLLVRVVAQFQQQRQLDDEQVRNPLASAENARAVSGPSAGSVSGAAVRAAAAGGGAGDFGQALRENDAVQQVSGQRLAEATTAGQQQQQLAAQYGGPLRAQSPRPQQQAPISLNFQDQVTPFGGGPTNIEVTNLGELARQLSVDPLVVMNFLSNRIVTLNGALRGPGAYLVGPSVHLDELVLAAGGTDHWADESGVELISTLTDPRSGLAQTRRMTLPLREGMLANYVVLPHDEFRFNQVFSDANLGNVTMQGEVRFAGTYKLTRGERLSDIISRAGGLTNTAYPYGTVFLRKSVAALEHEGYIRTAQEVQNQLVAAMTHVGSDKIEPNTFASMQTFVTELRNQTPLGRVAISADPSILASRPELDPLLESGDVIYIPQRPATVSVLGQVMQPGHYPYQANLTIADYIGKAGGYARFADEGETYVVLPDGTGRKMERSWLRYNVQALPPGSAIVVPRDITPLDLRQTVIDVSQIFSQLAISLASLAVLAKQ